MLDGDQRLWPGLGAFFLRGYNHKPLIAGAVERLGIPGIRFTDGPRGVVIGRCHMLPGHLCPWRQLGQCARRRDRAGHRHRGSCTGSQPLRWYLC